MPAKPKKYYPTFQFRVDQKTKDEFAEFCELKNTTPSAMIKSFMATQIAALWREKRRQTEGTNTADFLD